jgi:hypothetical protein
MSAPLSLSEDHGAADCLAQAYAKEAQGEGRAASVLLIAFISDHFEENRVSNVNSLLALADLSRLGRWSLGSMLRVTARWQPTLPDWDATYTKTKEILRTRGLDPDALLVGLRPAYLSDNEPSL